MADDKSDAPKSMSRSEFEAQIVAKAWQDEAYRKELLADPKAVLERELQAIAPDAKLPAHVNVKVVEEDPSTVYLVLPVNPKTIEENRELSVEELESVAGGVILVVFFFIITGVTDQL